MIIDSLKSQNVNDFYFEEIKKTKKKTHIFHFLNGRFFVMSEFLRVLRDFFEPSRKCDFATFLKI